MVLCDKICKLFLLPDGQWSDVLNIFRGSIPLSYHNSYSIYFRSIQMPWAKPHPHQSVQNDLCLTYLQLNYKGNSYMVLYDYIIHYDPHGKWSLQGVVCVGEPVFFEFPIRRLKCKPACRSVVCFLSWDRINIDLGSVYVLTKGILNHLQLFVSSFDFWQQQRVTRPRDKLVSTVITSEWRGGLMSRMTESVVSVFV